MIRELRPLEDALEVCAEEGRMYTYDIAGEPVNRRYTRQFPNGVIPSGESQRSRPKDKIFQVIRISSSKFQVRK